MFSNTSSKESGISFYLNLYQNAGYGRWVVGLVLYIISFLTTVGNGLVLHAIRTERRLQTVSNMFIMSLAIADLIVGTEHKNIISGLIVIPISATAFILGPEWHFGRAVCQVFLSIDYTASTASIFNLFILSLDRYWSITSPLRYLRQRTKKRALIMIGLAWLGSATWFVPVLGWHHFLYSGTRQTEENECETEFVGSVPFKVLSAIFNFHIPTVCMVVLYVRIFLAIKRRSVDIAQIAMQGNSPGEQIPGMNDEDSYTEAQVEGQGSGGFKMVKMVPL
ncbi:histamine H1 receptor [Eurytemora carolleeae]|uniref:histamine H1 receptor n=1 Tax=Eurytemora carolleeae TaxID=1294199 RepID=UPI000C79228C|nr:histamine H1 receptor [Eurytemora carolleeae]|eukprot:XP_023335304.1 histamine H1 receptor-like [Eurytemora affinis]